MANCLEAPRPGPTPNISRSLPRSFQRPLFPQKRNPRSWQVSEQNEAEQNERGIRPLSENPLLTSCDPKPSLIRIPSKRDPNDLTT